MREELLSKISAQERRHTWEQGETGAQVDEEAIKALAISQSAQR